MGNIQRPDAWCAAEEYCLEREPANIPDREYSIYLLDKMRRARRGAYDEGSEKMSPGKKLNEREGTILSTWGGKGQQPSRRSLAVLPAWNNQGVLHPNRGQGG